MADSRGMDKLLGCIYWETIGDSRKTVDLAAKIGQKHELRAGIRHWTEEQHKITRGMLAGKL